MSVQEAADGVAGPGGPDFDDLYRRYHSRLLRYCSYRLRDRHAAEDVTQEAFARAWSALPASLPPSAFYPWLRVVATNLCTDHQRRSGRSTPVPEVVAPPVEDAGFEGMARDAEALLVRRALGRLNDRHRVALSLREADGLSYEEIAARTGISHSAVESLLFRARLALKREVLAMTGGDLCLVLLAVGAAWGRRATRLARRLASRTQQMGLAGHLTLAAAATFAVASVVAGTHLVGSPPGRAAVLPAGPRLQQGRLASYQSQPPAASTVMAAVQPAVTRAPTAVPGTPSAPAAERAPAATAGHRTTIAVVNPVTTGPGASEEARTDPLSVGAGVVAVGADPTAVRTYVDQTAAAVKKALGTRPPSRP